MVRVLSSSSSSKACPLELPGLLLEPPSAADALSMALSAPTVRGVLVYEMGKQGEGLDVGAVRVQRHASGSRSHRMR